MPQKDPTSDTEIAAKFATPEDLRALAPYLTESLGISAANALALSNGNKPLSNEVSHRDYVEILSDLSKKLTDNGMGKDNADIIAKEILKLVIRAATLRDIKAKLPSFVDDIADLVISSSKSFLGDRVEAKQLPDNAPELYEARVNRDENAFDFMRRVWGNYLDAGILYQDDIKRLGDGKLIKAVRNFCASRGLDPQLSLPPPRQKRTDNAFNAAADGSAVKLIAGRRINQRHAAQKSRASRKP